MASTITNNSSIETANEQLFSGGGEMGALMRAFDWSKTPVGLVQNWPHSLKTAVRIVLTSRYAMFVWWGRELINLYNDPYRAFLGAKHPDALGKSARDVWAEIWETIGPRTDAVLLRGESTYDQALLLLMERHGYLEETYFTFSYSPLPDDQGNIGGLFCAVTEETQQVIGERRLKLLREIAADMSQARTPLQVSQAAALCLSKARRDLPFSLIYLRDPDGKTFRRAGAAGIGESHPAAPELIPAAPSGPVWPLDQVIEKGEMLVLENLPGRLSDVPTGEWERPPQYAALMPIAHQGQARPAGVLVCAVNPHRRLDDDFRGFLSLLGNQIAGAIANAVAYETELRRAESLAEIDRAKTLFFSNVSHEFRTPLTLMLGPLEDLLERSRDRLAAEDREQLTVVHRNALRLLKLVNTLLDFSRIEAGRAQALYEPTDLPTLTAEVASAFHSAMENAGLRFSVDCEPMGEPAYVDRQMWEKIVLNLLSNAFKFTFHGEIAVTLKLLNGSVVLAVRDTGPGIPEHEIPRIFERFHRIETTQSRTYEGTGIGLALVQELVRLHGGTVSVESTPGQGSTFTVSIPRGKEHLSADRIQAAAASSTLGSAEAYVVEAQSWLPQAQPRETIDQTQPRAVHHSGSTPEQPGLEKKDLVVVADDNTDMRNYLTRLLSAEYRVHPVCDGLQAVQAVQQLRPALLLTDIMMPGLDGFGVVQAIRSDPALSSTPVILVSARAGGESRVEGLQAGADDYLVKPFTALELVARVGTHVRMAKLRGQAAEKIRVAAGAQHRLAAIVESSDDAIISKDLNGIITSWNPAAEKMFGYTAREMIGKPILTIIPPELHSDEDMILGKIRSGEKIDHFETVRVTKTGLRLDVSLSISPVKDEQGNIIGAAKIARNITEKKKIENALRTTEKLAAAGRLAATVAHEVNNPLEAVTNLIYLAKRDLGNTGKVTEYLKLAQQELERVAHITRQTLGFYRDTSSPARFNISQMLDDLLFLYQTRLKNRNIRVVTQFERTAELTGLIGEVRQALSNLLSNAIDAMPGGGVLLIRVSQSRQWADSRLRGVRITFADTGSGIALEHRENLFQPFFTTKTDVGTGLGLWITQGIVEKHGGVIRFKSSIKPQNHGTVFSIFLPATPFIAGETEDTEENKPGNRLQGTGNRKSA